MFYHSFLFSSFPPFPFLFSFSLRFFKFGIKFGEGEIARIYTPVLLQEKSCMNDLNYVVSMNLCYVYYVNNYKPLSDQSIGLLF